MKRRAEDCRTDRQKKKSAKGKVCRHDVIVNNLELILFETMDYDKMWKFLEYCRNGQVGEVDLLAYADGIYDFYEVKCNLTDRSLKKAQEQYERYKVAFHRQRTNGFIYAGGTFLILQ